MTRRYLTWLLSLEVNIFSLLVVQTDQYECSTCGTFSLLRTLLIWRSLDHSTIIYESPQVGMGSLATSTSAAVARTPSSAPATQASTPLLRISPCSKDANLLATFHLDSSTVLILDIRQPGKELYNLVAHTGNIEASVSSIEMNNL